MYLPTMEIKVKAYIDLKNANNAPFFFLISGTN